MSSVIAAVRGLLARAFLPGSVYRLAIGITCATSRGNQSLSRFTPNFLVFNGAHDEHIRCGMAHPERSFQAARRT